MPLGTYGLLSIALTIYAFLAYRWGRSKPSKPLPALTVAVAGLVISLLSLLSGIGIGLEPNKTLLSFVLLWALFAMGVTFILTLQFSWER